MRANGEGSIYKRGDGRYVAALSLPYGKRKVYYGKTEEEALLRMREAERAQDKGANLLADDPFFGDFLKAWLEDTVRMSVRNSTFQNYKGITETSVIPALGKVRLSRLTPQVIQGYLNALVRRGLAPGTVHHHRGVIRRALKQALKWELVTKNNAALVDVPRIKKPHSAQVSPEIARGVLSAVAGHRLETLFLCAIVLGPRSGELLGLEWKDFDERARTLSITKNLQRVDGAFTFVELKTERSRRKLPVPEAVFESLRAHRERQGEEVRAFKQKETSSLIFRSRYGTPLHKENVLRQFQELLRKKGLPPMRFHDLRHAAISLLLSSGTDVRTVSEIAGHSQVSMTLNVYAHSIPGQSKAALDALGELLHHPQPIGTT